MRAQEHPESHRKWHSSFCHVVSKPSADILSSQVAALAEHGLCARRTAAHFRQHLPAEPFLFMPELHQEIEELLREVTLDGSPRRLGARFRSGLAATLAPGAAWFAEERGAYIISGLIGDSDERRRESAEDAIARLAKEGGDGLHLSEVIVYAIACPEAYRLKGMGALKSLVTVGDETYVPILFAPDGYPVVDLLRFGHHTSHNWFPGCHARVKCDARH